MHFYQINDLKNKKTVFLDENKNKVSSHKISKKFTKIPLGFPLLRDAISQFCKTVENYW